MRFNLLAIFTGLLGLSTSFLVAQPCISSFPYQENFDSGAGANGWASGTTQGSSNTWTLGTPAKPIINSASSAPNSWVTGGLTNGKYAANERSAVTSPCFDFTNIPSPQIKLRIWWNSEWSNDGAVLQSSINNGTTWQVVGFMNDPINWYNDNSIGGQPGGQTGNNVRGWTGSFNTTAPSNGWKTAQHLLNNLGGQSNVKLRIAFGADGSQQDDGFAFDDVIIQQEHQINLGPDRQLCGGASVTLSPGIIPNATYSWSTTATSPSISVFNPGTYICQVTDSLGFIDRDTVVVSTAGIFLTLGPDQSICGTQTVTLNSGNSFAAIHSWTTGNGAFLANGTTYTVTTPGTYIAVVGNNIGCTVYDTINILGGQLPPINLGPDTAICAGNSILLDAGAGVPGTTYQWNFGAQSQSVAISAPGFYYVTASIAGGCYVSDSVNVMVIPAPVVNLGADRVECGTFTLNAGNPGYSYLWNTNATSQSINASTAGIYWVKVTAPNGCYDIDTIQIFSATSFAVNLGNDKALCDGNPVILDAGSFGTGFNFLWSNSLTSQTITVTTPGIYSVVVTSPQGCVKTDTVKVNISTLSVNLGPDIALCNGQSAVLVAGLNPANSYSWSTGATTANITVTTGGTYIASVLDNLGCIILDTVNVTLAGNFIAAIGAPATGFVNQAVSFTDNTPGATGWIWDFGDSSPTSNLQNPTHTFLSVGTFNVTLTANNGLCVSTDTKPIQINVFISVEEAMHLQNFRLYPNPNQGVFQLEMETDVPADMQLTLTDLNGREILRQTLPAASFIETVIDISTVSPGMYLFSLEKEGVVMYGKVMVE